MSDYAGTALQVIGTVMYAFPATAAFAPWVQAAGTALNAYNASQTVLPGPKIGEVQKQTSVEGGFRPIIYGRSNPIAGNIIADGGAVIVPERTGGKGGPKQGKGESAFRTYAVGFCEGEATLLQAWRNGILVYDVEDPTMGPENAKFLEYATWYTGAFDQAASPDLESIYGAGQAPYFRGTAYLSIHEEDVTDQRGAWSQWQVRVFRGAAKSYTTPPYPVFDSGTLEANAVPRGGSVMESAVDRVTTGLSPLGGQLRDIVQQYFSGPDEVLSSLLPLGGELIQEADPLKIYATPPEAVNAAGLQPLGGELRLTRLDYLNYEPESINTSSVTPLGGTLQ